MFLKAALPSDGASPREASFLFPLELHSLTESLKLVPKCVMPSPPRCSFLASPTEYLEGESLFYIVSPRDVVVAKERDQDDHIDWLLEKKKYEVVLILLS